MKREPSKRTSSSRREFLKKASIVAPAAVAATSLNSSFFVHAQTKYQWKMVTTWPKNFPVLGTGAQSLANLIKSLSSGRIEIKVLGDGEMVPALQVFDTVSQGKAEMGHGAAYYWRGKHEACQFFSAVPFGMNALEMNAWIYHGGGQALWDEVYSGFQLKAFTAGHTGVQMGGWFKKEIKSLADFKGLKIRMPGLGGEVLRRLGATVVSIPGGEILSSLQSGAIDACEWVGPVNDLAFGLHQGARHYYWPGWHEPTAALELMINKKIWETLPSDLQQVIEIATQACNLRMHSEYQARNAIALETLTTKHGVSLKKFSDEILKGLGELSRSVVQEVAAKDPLTKKVFESYQQFRKSSILYGRISEEGYSLARHLSDV